jgi:hypothetical protein
VLECKVAGEAEPTECVATAEQGTFMASSGDIVGETLTARVVRIEPYGLYLAYGDATIFVLIVDVSESSIRDLQVTYQTGEKWRKE